MSEYSPFFAQDFAGRCRDLLNNFYGPAKAKDREVTLLLAVAAAGLVVPYERLSPETKQRNQPFLDRPRQQRASEELQGVLSKPIGESGLLGSKRDAWEGGLLKSARGTPDEWPEFRTKHDSPAKTPVSDLVTCLRHGLAHGNITTRAGGTPRVIERIVFVCGYESTPSLRFVSVAPDDLNDFLQRWFDCLAALKVERDVLAAVLDACEAA